MTNDATERQNSAAHPGRSTWLSANAGSGKTRVLTDRVARLLLNGADPQNILCLTYTKAAASEMQNRLFRTLGEWAMWDDKKLRKALESLGEPVDADLSRARTLFARAVETPGGLKIQTIHSLCASILRQFPLEAGVSPQFRELDEAGQGELIDEVLSQLARANDPALAIAAQRHPATLAEMAREVAGKADDFETPRTEAEIFHALDVPHGRTMQDILGQVFRPGDIALLKRLAPVFRQNGTKRDVSLADAFEDLPSEPSLYVLELLEEKLLKGKGANVPFSPNDSPTAAVKKIPAFQTLEPDYIALKERVEAARPQRIELQTAELTSAVHAFAQSFLPAYEAAKAERGVLDFDDLIRRTRKLLTAQSLQWVLYRLDARIDHILVDEAQDTSPAQWQVIEALAEEMASGTQDRHRTFFVVGDKKQSIYSFQGADAESFDRYKAAFDQQLQGAGGLHTRELLHSFRSSPAILNAVDAVFGGNAGTGVGNAVRHEAFHDAMPGRVDLWPLMPRDSEDNDLDWHSTDHRKVAVPPAKQLAEQVAKAIRDLIETGTIPGEKGKARRIRAGDIMVLVRRRSEIFDQIIAACKRLEIPLAGADRMKIGSELAVRDLLALLAFLDLPDDDLSLAAALRSPLLGFSESDLFRLASERGQNVRLWQALRDRRADFPGAYAKLSRLLDKVDFQRPYELLDRILTREGGRKALLARLGPEAQDGIDELLRQALVSEQNGVPSLTRFLADAQAADIEVRRESETTGNLVRIMTVHGAKGLESPIVILPDTTGGKPRLRYELIDGPGFPVVRTSSTKRSRKIEHANETRERAEAAERDRLLYVAMTRAEKWLIVCGVEPANNQNAIRWHEQVSAGLDQCDTEKVELPDIGTVKRLSFGTWPESPGEEDGSEPEGQGEPLRISDKVPPAPRRQELRAPSDLGGDKVLGGGALEEEDAKKRGRQVHRLLETLGATTDADAFATRLFATGPDAAAPDEVPGLVAEATAAIAAHPAIYAAGALAEVDIVADTSVGRISGTIDRLLVAPDRVVAVDFKTNAVVPETPGETPESLLRQMGAYLEALEKLYPDRPVELAILWTYSAEYMTLPHGIVRAALQRTPTS